MNDWELLEIREAVLRDLADLIPPNLYGNPSLSDAAIDWKVGQMLKSSSVHMKMTIRQRRASFLLWNLGMYCGTRDNIPLFEEDCKREHYSNSLGSLKENLLEATRSYADCLSEDERKLLPMPEENNIKQQDDLKESERNSLLKLVISMAIGGYSYDPGASKNEAISQITEDLEMLGLSLSDDTVRKYLQQAAAKFPQARKA